MSQLVLSQHSAPKTQDNPQTNTEETMRTVRIELTKALSHRILSMAIIRISESDIFHSYAASALK